MLSAVLAGLSQWHFFIPEYHWLAILTYVVDAIVCVLLIEYVNRSLEKETEAARHETLLREELQHRIQNLFAVIQAVVRFSLPSNEARVSAAAIKDGLLDRLQALVDANRHVSDATGEVALIDLIHSQMRIFAERYTVHGRPQMTLNPQLTQNFSLVLHELVTNSLKYGALSAADGSVQIKLQEVPTGVLFDWRESGGPPVIAPPADGGSAHVFLARLRGASAPTSPSPTSQRACITVCKCPAGKACSREPSQANRRVWPIRPQANLIHVKAASAKAPTFNLRLARQSSLWDLSRAASTEPSHLWVVPVGTAFYFCPRRNSNERDGLARRGTRYRRPVRTAGSFCRTPAISAQASCLMRFLLSRTVK